MGATSASAASSRALFQGTALSLLLGSLRKDAVRWARRDACEASFASRKVVSPPLRPWLFPEGCRVHRGPEVVAALKRFDPPYEVDEGRFVPWLVAQNVDVRDAVLAPGTWGAYDLASGVVHLRRGLPTSWRAAVMRTCATPGSGASVPGSGG